METEGGRMRRARPPQRRHRGGKNQHAETLKSDSFSNIHHEMKVHAGDFPKPVHMKQKMYKKRRVRVISVPDQESS
jgi:hypothetical protein